LRAQDQRVDFFSQVLGQRTRLESWVLPRRYADGEWIRLEMRVMGARITVSADGRELGTVHDSSVTEPGYVHLHGEDSCFFRDVVLVPLDEVNPPRKAAAGPGDRPTSAASSTTQTATKDAPFVNSLGMKFVPVAIVGGPTAGQRVLFCLWDTRVRDYEAFTAETKHGWWRVDEMSEEEMPAVNMSWNDARTFCQWLTDREHKARTLGAGEAYRLPKDHEWSCAVGLGAREDPDAKPSDKCDRIPGFAWGTQWPPPPGAGNFAGEEASAVGMTPQHAGLQFMKGYRDEYPLLAPVGRFPANQFGLFDMAGNAWQWCEEVYGTDEKGRVNRVIRGGGWNVADAAHALSSHRSGSSELSHFDGLGFRCVLAPVAGGETSR
jgi:hypothetical protein